jgi:RimJ/RimL family protein N-acetyltransferase
MHTIRRLKIGEADLYRRLRLEALKDAPGAFSSTYESALQRDEQSWAQQADSSAQGSGRATFVVIGERPIGLASIYRDTESPSTGELLQMWIALSHRGSGVAAELLDQLFERALRFYGKYGFQVVPSSDGTVLTKQVEHDAGGGPLLRPPQL